MWGGANRNSRGLQAESRVRGKPPLEGVTSGDEQVAQLRRTRRRAKHERDNSFGNLDWCHDHHLQLFKVDFRWVSSVFASVRRQRRKWLRS